MAISKEALRFAFGKLEDFYTVQKDKPFKDKMEAVEILRESLGIDNEMTVELSEWSGDFNGPGLDGPVMMGLLIGLLATDYESW